MSRPPDILSPPNLTQLSDFDNYEIYSIVAACLPAVPATGYTRSFTQEIWKSGNRETITTAQAIADNAALDPYIRVSGNYPRGATVSTSSVTGGGSYRYSQFTFDRILQSFPARQNTGLTQANARKIYAIQTFSPGYQVDFSALENIMGAYPPKSGGGWIIGTGGTTIQWFAPVSEFDWTKLSVNGRLKFSGISSFDGILTYSYWAYNPLEQHPQIDLTCDYCRHTIKVSEGKQFAIELNHPIAQTLKISNSLGMVEQSSTVTGNKPANFTEYLIGSTAYATRIEPQYPPPPPKPVPDQPPNDDLVAYTTWNKELLPNGGRAGGWEYKLGGTLSNQDLTTTKYRAVYTAPSLQYQILPATNDYWGHGAALPTYTDFNCSLPDLPQGMTYDRLHFEPQTDGSFGELTMDSIRTIETLEKVSALVARITAVENALDAGVYGFDPDQPSEKRGANLGWYIEKIAQVLGIRRQPNGKYLEESEISKYQRTRANNPTWSQGDYAQSTWAKFGMAIKYLPTTYEGGQRQDNKYDIVHDFPQMLAAILDQIDHSQGIQHSSNIRLPVGDQVQAYPNQGAAVQDMAARMIALERSIEQLQVLAIEQGNSVRELYPGIGIPVTTKSVHVEIGGKVREIFYPAYQQSKPSLRQVIGSLQEQAAITLGALMPRKNPLTALNPWRKNK
jgi:hypothetical protein